MSDTTRPAATWTVFELASDAVVKVSDRMLAIDATVLIEIDGNVPARTDADACWHIAETQLKDRATGDEPPVLTASRNGTAHGLTEARPYALKATVERVK